MPRIFSFLLGVAAGVMLCFGATNYHVVRGQDGFHVVPKQRARLAEAYIDVRKFGVSDWASHAELSAALVAANQQSVMNGATANSVEAGLSQLPNWNQQ
jgi:hypothetical protein